MNKCHHCETPTKNPKFCSRSCSAVVANKSKPKRPLTKVHCKRCGEDIKRTGWKDRRTLCNDCNSSFVDWNTVTLSGCQEMRNYQRNSRIRALARYQYHKQNPNASCQKCGYDYHVEICHIKAIKDFDPSATIAEVNDPSNLMALCRNCHWELDHPKP